MRKLVLIDLALGLALLGVASIPAVATASDPGATPPAPAEEHSAAGLSPADRLLARLGYVRGDYRAALADGEAHELHEQDEMIADALAAASALPLAPATLAQLQALSASVTARAPAKDVETAIDGAVARVREELWLELAAPEPTRIEDGAALFAANCASCHGAHGEGPPPEMAALTPPPVALSSRDVSARLSPRRVYETVTFGIPDTAMVGRADQLTEAERWALGFYAVSLGAGPAPTGPARAGGSPPPATPPGSTPAKPVVAKAPAPPAGAPTWTFEELADLTNAALLAKAPAGTKQDLLASWRGHATLAAATSPLRELRTLARAAVGPGGEAALRPLHEGWHRQRAVLVGVDKKATVRVDAALAALDAAKTEDARRDAARVLVEALQAVERRAP